MSSHDEWAVLPGYEDRYKVLKDRSKGVVVWSIDRQINGNFNFSNNGAQTKKRQFKGRLVTQDNGRYRLKKNRQSMATYLADNVYDAAWNGAELKRLTVNG